VGAHFAALALKADAARLDQVRHSHDGFALAAAATAHEFDEFAKVVNRPMDFVWSFFHIQVASLHSL